MGEHPSDDGDDEQPTTIPQRPAAVPEGSTWLGRDTAGRQHWAHGRLPRGEIIVTDGDSVELRETLDDEHVRADWIDHISEHCGWDIEADEIGLVDELAAALGVDA